MSVTLAVNYTGVQVVFTACARLTMAALSSTVRLHNARVFGGVLGGIPVIYRTLYRCLYLGYAS